MSSRTFFILFIRILGIVSIKATVLSFFDLLPVIFRYGTFSTIEDSLGILVLQAIVFVAYAIVSYLLIAKAADLVDRFNLSRDVESVLQININAKDVVRIALLVTSAILLATEIPSLVATVTIIASSKDTGLFGAPEPNWAPAIISVVKIIIGLLLIGERDRILTLFFRDEVRVQDGNDPQEQVQ